MNSKSASRYKGDRHAIKFNCRDQFMVMSFAQFTDRSGLRDIETTLNLCGDLYRSGIKVMPKYIWLAIGGKSQFNESLNVLQSRDIIAFPDVDGYDTWIEKAAFLPHLNIKVSNLLQKTPPKKNVSSTSTSRTGS